MTKIVVVGTGSFGKNHVRVLNELGALGGTIDKNEEMAKKYGQLYNAPWSSNVEAFDFRSIDGAVIATPTTTHKEIAKSLIAKGVHYLFLEKPFVANVSDAVELSDFGKQNDVKFMAGFIERFNQGVLTAKEYLEQNKIGRPIIMTALRIRRWPDRPVDLGVVKDAAIHDIDIARFILKGQPISVYARAGSLTRSTNEDHATVIMNFGQDCWAILEANWITPSKSRRLTLTGFLGYIEADLITQEVTLKNAEGSFTRSAEWKEPLVFELKHFIDCISTRRKPSPDEKDAVANLAIAEAALTSNTMDRSLEFKQFLGNFGAKKLQDYL